MFIILGAGLSGLSVAKHFQDGNIPFKLYESKAHGGGHIYSEVVDGFTWDEGPHVSFTKYDYVKKFFAQNVHDKFLEYPTKPTNYHGGNWIPHPAQSNLYAVPEDLRSACIKDILEIRKIRPSDVITKNYQEWLTYAFGGTFSEVFPKVYTKKYWTTEPQNLTTDWIGNRIFFPEPEDMVRSADGPLDKETHYITKVRYPETGGYYSYIKPIENQVPIQYNKEVRYISFNKKEVHFSDGEKVNFERLVSSIPLPLLIKNSDAPADVKQDACRLKCSKVLIINVVADHSAVIDNQWLYVYDEEMYSTRINFTELLAPSNGVSGKTGIQVEVYFSEYKPLTESIEMIEKEVLRELVRMKLIKAEKNIESYHSRWIEWANVIFDHEKRDALDKVLGWLESNGLVREEDDLEPMTDWDSKQVKPLGSIILAGRFAQWKYYWTDDCVMRGLHIGRSVIK
jgi:protoporphyrinogen oxidase